MLVTMPCVGPWCRAAASLQPRDVPMGFGPGVSCFSAHTRSLNIWLDRQKHFNSFLTSCLVLCSLEKLLAPCAGQGLGDKAPSSCNHKMV